MATLALDPEATSNALRTAVRYERCGRVIITLLVAQSIWKACRIFRFKSPDFMPLASTAFLLAEDPMRIITHTGLSIPIFGTGKSLTIVPQILPNTCAVATKALGHSKRYLWPCTRDQITTWIGRVVSEKQLDLAELWKIQWLWDYVLLFGALLLLSASQQYLCVKSSQWLGLEDEEESGAEIRDEEKQKEKH